MNTHRPRVVLAKLGLDGHDVGILLVAKMLLAEGFEVIYLGKRNRPIDVAHAIVDEDADVAGVSALSGGAGRLVTDTIAAVRRLGGATPILFGGIAEAHEIEAMTSAGVSRCFGPDSTLDQVVAAFRECISARAR